MMVVDQAMLLLSNLPLRVFLMGDTTISTVNASWSAELTVIVLFVVCRMKEGRRS